MYVKLSWRPEVDDNWAIMVVQPAIWPTRSWLELFVSQKNAKNQYALLPGISITVLASHFSSVIGNFRSSGRLDLHVWGIIHVCQAILETGSGRKLGHNGCTAANFDLPDHGFLLLNCSRGPMECSTGNSYQAEALTNVLMYHTCWSSLPEDRNMFSFYFWSPSLAQKMRKTNMRYYQEYPSRSWHPILVP
jgi:hypothetical protein